MNFITQEKLFGLLISVFLFSIACFGQNESNKTVSANSDQTKADENFELNITQDRIVETDFKRSTNVELTNSERGGLRVEVGVGVRAERIDVNLRGILGRVRFRASLVSLRQKIEQLQNSAPAKNNSPTP